MNDSRPQLDDLPPFRPEFNFWLTPRQTADVLNISSLTLKTWRQAGRAPLGSRLPFERRGAKTVVYRLSDVLNFIDSNWRARKHTSYSFALEAAYKYMLSSADKRARAIQAEWDLVKFETLDVETLYGEPAQHGEHYTIRTFESPSGDVDAYDAVGETMVMVIDGGQSKVYLDTGETVFRMPGKVLLVPKDNPQ